jgi:catechol 2,3-dioxygenase
VAQDLGLSFSHVGLFVTDMAGMVDFFSGVLGFTITDRGQLGATALTFLSRDPSEHHQIVLVEGRPPGLPDRIVNQVSFRVGTLGELQAVYRRLRTLEMRELTPITHGNAWSVYFRDPEGNRMEVFTDSDWYISQPVREAIDIDRPEAEIRRETEAFCRARPGFRPIAEWRAELKRRIAAEREQTAAKP